MSKPRTLKGTLRAIRRVLEKGWTKQYLARDKWGHKVHNQSPRAERFCMLGAISKVDGPMESKVEKVIRSIIQKRDGFYFSGIPTFNDSYLTKKSDVLAVIDEAIAQV